jgi:hypothetical protein
MNASTCESFSDDFYPTPRDLAGLMVSKVSKEARNFLEPSAGKGDLAKVMRGDNDYGRRMHYGQEVDCIELQPELCAVLRDKNFPVVGYDWLTYNGVSYYDAIVMNPPFSNGEDHLLRAWDFLYNGEIVCLLNQATIDNPHSAARQRLVKIVMEHGAVEPLGQAFSAARGAERYAHCNVALVYLKKVAEDDRVDLWASETAEKAVSSDIGASHEDAMLAIVDKLGNMEHYYNMANEHMFKAFEHLRKAAIYLGANDIHTRDEYPLSVSTAFSNINHAKAEFGRQHRKDAWKAVLKKMEFGRWLDKQQTDQFYRDIEREANIPFTAENIRGTLENIFENRKRLFDQSVVNVFDALTKYYKENTAHVEGWKTNDSYKVNQRLVFPYGCTYEGRKYPSLQGFSTRYDGPIDLYHDLDRVLCVLDGAKECFTIGYALNAKFRNLGTIPNCPGPFDNTCESTYFSIKFWKKGTVHLKWKRLDLWEAFNIAASAGKKWLGERTQDHNKEPEWGIT